MARVEDSPPLEGLVLLHEASQYGAEVFKPANKLAQLLCDIARTRTMTWATIATVKATGLTVKTIGAAPRQL